MVCFYVDLDANIDDIDPTQMGYIVMWALEVSEEMLWHFIRFYEIQDGIGWLFSCSECMEYYSVLGSLDTNTGWPSMQIKICHTVFELQLLVPSSFVNTDPIVWRKSI